MKIFVRAILLLAISIAASAASAASVQLDLPDGAKLIPNQTGRTLTFDFPQCGTVSVWGEGDAIRVDCFDNNVATGRGMSLLKLSGCPEVSAWGSGTVTSGTVTSVDCVDFAQQRVQEAYLAFYGRPADRAGLAYWTSRLEKAGGSMAPIIDAFGKSREFDDRYGGLSNRELVKRVYLQTLGRDADSTGLDWYVQQLDLGAFSPGTIVLNVLDGAVTHPDATVVANRIHFANHYIARCTYGLPTQGSDLLESVKAESESVKDAIDAIDNACGGG